MTGAFGETKNCAKGFRAVGDGVNGISGGGGGGGACSCTGDDRDLSALGSDRIDLHWTWRASKVAKVSFTPGEEVYVRGHAGMGGGAPS